MVLWASPRAVAICCTFMPSLKRSRVIWRVGVLGSLRLFGFLGCRLAQSTIISHLSHYVREREIGLRALISSSREKKIRDFMQAHPEMNKISEIRQAMGGDYEYWGNHACQGCGVVKNTQKNESTCDDQRKYFQLLMKVLSTANASTFIFYGLFGLNYS